MFIENIWITPCAFLIHSLRSSETYGKFLRFLFQTEALRGHATPNAVIGDYEEALKSGSMQAFSGNILYLPPPKKMVYSHRLFSYYGDYFHFMQANIKNIHHHLHRKLLASERVVIVSSLRTLWWSSNVEVFRQNRDVFLNFWQQHCPSYAEYFCHEWLHRIVPSVWAR